MIFINMIAMQSAAQLTGFNFIAASGLSVKVRKALALDPKSVK